MKYILVTSFALFLIFVAVGNREVITETFFPKDVLVAQISLGNKNIESREARETKNKEDLKVEICSFKTSSTIPTVPPGPVILNEVAWMGSEESFSNEWIEIKNISDSAVNVSGWQLLDKDEQIKMVFSEEIDSGEFLLLRRGEDFSGNLRNSDEGLRLFDGRCNLVDEVFATPDWPAGDNKSKFTMERSVHDFSWVSSSIAGGTPGKENSQGLNSQTLTSVGGQIEVQKTETKLLISEIMVGTEENSKNEFIELYNAGEEVINLTGWNIKKRNSKGNEGTFVSKKHFDGKAVPAQSYFLLTSVGGCVKCSPDLRWPSSYSMAYTNNAILLYNPAGSIVDSVSWEEIPRGSSLERSSWNENRFKIQTTPDPQGLK